MTTVPGRPFQAATAISDMLDNVAQLQPGQRVLILAHVDGLYGGPNLVDEQTIAWIQAAVQQRGAHATVVWLDEPFAPYHWRLPPVLKAALAGADVMINHSFDLTIEEIQDLNETLGRYGVLMVRNFATTTPLLCSAYAYTPSVLVAEIRFQVGQLFTEGAPFRFTHPNGTHLEGTLGPPRGAGGAMYYTQWRRETNYRPFPEWVHPPVTLIDTDGELIFDRMLSWWSRYIGVPPFFKRPVRVIVQRGRMVRFEGADEAEALQRFFATLAERLGATVYEFPQAHSGVHPNARLEPHQCLDERYRRLIDHQHTSNVHFHLGNARNLPGWPYMLHVTADIQGATWQVGEALVHDRGHMTVLDHPRVRAIAERYPNRPGITPHPWR